MLCALSAAVAMCASAPSGVAAVKVNAPTSTQTFPLAISAKVEAREGAAMQIDTLIESVETLTAAPEKVYEADSYDVEIIARLLWGECRGVPSKMERAAVVWCVLNRLDDDRWGDTIKEVITQKGQFTGYSSRHPVDESLSELAEDVLIRWMKEKDGVEDVGRVLPKQYVFFAGRSDRRNHFRDAYRGGNYWDWSCENPYED